MTLAFSQQLNGKSTFFVDRILNGLLYSNIINHNEHHFLKIDYFKKTCFQYAIGSAKFHTIRDNSLKRWKPGTKIHFVINNRTKNRFQFAPIVPVISLQEIQIKYCYNPKTENFDLPFVLIDGREIKGKELTILANNDGFDTVEDFFEYFNTDITKTIIHWTNFKY